MNVRSKIISVIMSFLICFSFVGNSFANDKEQLNYNIKPLVVDGGIISAPMVATVASLAVASGVILSSNDDIYDIARVFYHQNKENWENVKQVFDTCVSIGANKLITVGNDFLELVKNTFSTWFTDSPIKYNSYGIPIGFENSLTYDFVPKTSYSDSEVVFSITPGVYAIDIVLGGTGSSGTSLSAYASFNGESYRLVSGTISNSNLSKTKKMKVYYNNNSNANFRSINFIFADAGGNYLHGLNVYMSAYESYNKNMGSFDIPYTPGSFNWDSVESKKENNSVALPVPGNLGTLVGQGSADFWDNADNLVGGGSIALPGVSNPSISVTDDVFVGSPSTDIPGVDNPGIDKPGIVFPPFGGGLDFTPITQSSFVDKFPFSLAKDIKNIVSVFDVEPKAPKFTVPIVSEELEIDLTQFNIWASIIRFFVLIGFMIALINITRKVIG